MLADCLTKNTSSRYLAYVMREGLFHLIRHPDIEWVYVEEKQREQIKKREYIQKYRSEAKRAKGKAARVDSHETLVEKIPEGPEADEPAPVQSGMLATLVIGVGTAMTCCPLRKAQATPEPLPAAEPPERQTPEPLLAAEQSSEHETLSSNSSGTRSVDEAPAETTSVQRPVPASFKAPGRWCEPCRRTPPAPRPAEFVQHGERWRQYKPGEVGCPHQLVRGPYQNQYGKYLICNACRAGWRMMAGLGNRL